MSEQVRVFWTHFGPAPKPTRTVGANRGRTHSLQEIWTIVEGHKRELSPQTIADQLNALPCNVVQKRTAGGVVSQFRNLCLSLDYLKKDQESAA